MYSQNVRRILIAILILGWASVLVCMFYKCRKSCSLFKVNPKDAEYIEAKKNNSLVDQASKLLRQRKDTEALVIFDKILKEDPENINALWGKAEILRRNYKFKEARDLLNIIFVKRPEHPPSLITLAYIEYKRGQTDKAIRLCNKVLKNKDTDTQTMAFAYVVLGGAHSKLAQEGMFFTKIRNGIKIKGNFSKAIQLSPDLAEARLGLGSFYLLAPRIAGGNIDKAIEELELAVKFAPDFATANARLAQAYKARGALDKYNMYLGRAKELDPDNEIVKELEGTVSNDKN